jgi:hypothetical protein
MYTSRPALKGLIRGLEAVTHESEAWYAAAALNAPGGVQTAVLPAVGYARATSGVMAHHDAITGACGMTSCVGPLERVRVRCATAVVLYACGLAYCCIHSDVADVQAQHITTVLSAPQETVTATVR